MKTGPFIFVECAYQPCSVCEMQDQRVAGVHQQHTCDPLRAGSMVENSAYAVFQLSGIHLGASAALPVTLLKPSPFRGQHILPITERVPAAKKASSPHLKMTFNDRRDVRG